MAYLSKEEEKALLNSCCRSIVEKLKWQSPEYWTKKNFMDLSDQIFNASKIYISYDTLKRIFVGKRLTRDFYHPQMETKNGLAVFLGYESWEDYCKANHPISTLEKDFGNSRSKKPGLTEINRKWLLFPILFIFVAVLITWTIFRNSTPSPSIWPEVILQNDTFGFAPYTLKFRIRKNPDTILVFKGARRPKFPPAGKIGTISPTDSFFAHTLSSPAFHYLLFTRGKDTIFNKPFHILTKGWKSFIYHKGDNITQVPLDSFYNSPYFKVSDPYFNIFSKTRIESECWTEFRLSQKFPDRTDSLDLSFEIVPAQRSGSLACPHGVLKIIHEVSSIDFGFFGPDCQSEPFISSSTYKIAGSHTDLGLMCLSLSNKNKVRITLRKKQIDLTVNGNRKSFPTDVPSGRVKMISVAFPGAGLFGKFTMNGRSYLAADSSFSKEIVMD
jgi:hypothetical protein